MEQKRKKDSLVLGFALFAMFFGAGNLIFPPYLGFNTGSDWWIGFLSFIFVDAALGVFALLMLNKAKWEGESLTAPLGKIMGMLLLALTMVCIGPMVGIPRTAATTFELGVQAICPAANTWLITGVYFLIVVLLCLRPSKVVDIIGAVLTPVMLVALVALIVLGVFFPIGEIPAGTDTAGALQQGVTAGYQTMDMMAAVVLSTVFFTSVVNKGYFERKEKTNMLLVTGGIATMGLFLVYGGLTYLGATAGGAWAGENFTQAELLQKICHTLVGDVGLWLLGIIVAAACLTTAIGLLSSCAEFFEEMFCGRVKYAALVVILAVLGFLFSNIGLSQIISLASPVLSVLYPVWITLSILRLCSRFFRWTSVRVGAAGAFVSSLVILIVEMCGGAASLSVLPLYDLGLGWLVPTVLVVVAGKLAECLMPKKKA